MRFARAGAAASANGACGAVVIAARMRLSQPSSLAAITPFHTLRAARQRRHRAHPLQLVRRNHMVPAVAPAYSERSCGAQGRGKRYHLSFSAFPAVGGQPVSDLSSETRRVRWRTWRREPRIPHVSSLARAHAASRPTALENEERRGHCSLAVTAASLE